MTEAKKTAVILFNMGGPDEMAAVKPFLRNLFSDPAILHLPGPLRYLVAWLISSRRAAVAGKIYEQMGGKSPILENTQAQADALQARLGDRYRVFVCMRYWHPMSAVVAEDVKLYAPDQIVLLPLYPQFSTTTTASSLLDWERAAARAGLVVPTATVCCYPTENRFIAAHAKLLREAYFQASGESEVRILFSAHGLPQKIADSGDPYCWQVQQTAQALISVMGMDRLDWRICYQSNVGPIKWVGPSTEEEIHRAGEAGMAVVLVPIAFVSEHSETLVELDIDYAKLARESGVKEYVRVPALGTTEEFIESLEQMAKQASGTGCEGLGKRCCPEAITGCPCIKGSAG